MRPASLWRDTLSVVVRQRSAVIGLAILGVMIVAAVFAPLITWHDPIEQNAAGRFLAPSWEHPFGTDQFGRPVYGSLWQDGGVLVAFPVRPNRPHLNQPIRPIQGHAVHSRFFQGRRPQPAGVIQQHLVKFAAYHLEGEIRFVVDDVIEAPRRHRRPVFINEAHPRLADKVALHFIQQP